MRLLNLAFLWWYKLWGDAVNNQLLLIKKKNFFSLTILCRKIVLRCTDFLKQETIKLGNKKVMYFYKTIVIRKHFPRSLHISASRDWGSWVVMSTLCEYCVTLYYTHFPFHIAPAILMCKEKKRTRHSVPFPKLL